MRHFTKIAVAASVILLSSFCASAQTKKYRQDIGFTVGTNVPLSVNEENDVIVGITYGQFYHNGCGFRTGFQYAPTAVEIDNYFGVPIAFAYRTGSKKTSERFNTALYGTADTYYDDIYWNRGVSAGGMFGTFLMNLFSQAEFFAGITPGYVAGESKTRMSDNGVTAWWTEKPHSLSLSMDAGMSLNYRIWRFNLKAIPAFHYYLTNNFERHKALINPDGGNLIPRESQPARWFFTFSGCLAFEF